MGEIAVERPVDGGLHWAQWAAALNSRGFSLGYQRDRFEDGPSTGTLRFGLALPFPRGAVGAAFSFYSGNAIDTTNNTVQGLDIGARYRLLSPLEVGAVVRNIGRPVLRDSVAPLVGTLSLALHPLADHVVLAGEAMASERLSASGYDLSYRAGLQIATGGSLPFTLVSSLDLESDFHPRSWFLGVAIGGQDRGIALGSGGWDSPRNRLERISLTGVASRQLGGAR